MCRYNRETGFSEKAPNMTKDDTTLQGCFSPTKAIFRYTGLILMCFMGFGSYFCYDSPAALQDNFKIDLDMSTDKYVMLYSICSWPNIIMSFIGGFLLDSVFGVRWGTIIYISLTLVGHVIFATAVYVNAFWLMMVGRFFFGIGTDSLTVAQNSYAVLWFKGKELNTVFGLQLCFARVGSSINFLIMENIYSYVLNTLLYVGPEGVGVTLFIAGLTCVASMISAIFLSVMDRKAEKVLKRNENQNIEIMKIQDVKNFRNIFWLLALICVTYYVTIFPFLSLAKIYFITKYEYEPATANTVTSLVYIISAVACPLFGILVDKTGKNILWVIASVIGTLLAHCLLAFTYVSPYIPMVILAFSFSLFASTFWTLIALTVLEQQLGTAYGIVIALENLGLAVIPIVCGIIVVKYGYFTLEMFFLVWLFISLVTAVIVWKLDRPERQNSTFV